MKFKSLSAAALVAVIGAGTLLPMAASATEEPTPSPEYAGQGTVTIEAGNINPNEELPDPEIPGETIDPVTPIDPNPNPGQLGIVKVSPLNFGTVQTSSSERIYPAAAVAVRKEIPEGGTRDTTRGHFIEFQDVRGTRAGYTVTAQLDQQFTLAGTSGATAETLAGSTINYTNGIITNDTGAVIPTTFASSFNLTEESGAVDVVGAAQGEGSGKFILEYGQSEDYIPENEGVAPGGQAGTDANSVFLTIPDDTFSNMLVGNYEAVILWTVTDGYTPAP